MSPAVARKTCTSIRSRWRTGQIVLVLMIALAANPARLAGQSEVSAPIVISDVKLGYAGVARIGAWIPISAEIRSPDEKSRDVSVVWCAPDPEANECRFTDEQLHVVEPPGTTVHGVVRLGRSSPSVVVEVLHDDRVAARNDAASRDRIQVISSTTRLILSLGTTLELESATRLQSSMRQQPVAIAQLTNASSLPNEPLAYDGVDLVVLLMSDASVLNEIRDQQWDALQRWVQGGGRIMISLDPAAPLDSTLGQHLFELIGVNPVAVERQRDTTGLENFAGVEQRIDVAVRAHDEPWEGLAVVRLAPSRAKIIAFDGLGTGQSHWIQQTTVGLGIVTIANFDLNDSVLHPWTGRSQLLGRLIELALGLHESPDESHGRELAHWGYSDLTGQLRLALDQVRGARVVPFALVAIAIGLYVLLISAGDFFLLRHVVRNLGWTWATLPLLIGATCLVAYAWTVAWKGTEQRTNQIDFVDIDPTTGAVRVRSWCHLFVPNARRIDLRWRPDESFLPAERVSYRWCGWEGMPGTGFGGMESQAASPLFRHQYTSLRQGGDFAPEIRLLKVPMLAWSSRGFEAGALLGLTPEQVPPMRADSLNQLQGRIRNPLTVSLRDCALLFDRWYYELGTLEPNGLIELTSRHQPLDLKARLTRKRIVDAKEVTSPWDPAATDIARIAEMIMFHQAAGGTLFTGLRHEYRDSLDFSRHLLLNTAVLVGRPARPLTDFVLDDDDQPLQSDRRAALVRILIPVEAAGAP